MIANIDIGGGTANIAVYKDKVLLGTCTMHIGGRLIEYHEQKISSISRPVQQLLAEHHRSLHVGDSSRAASISFVTDFMAESLGRVVRNELGQEDRVLLLGHQPSWSEDIDVLVFSGGISECIYNHETVVDAAG